MPGVGCDACAEFAVAASSLASAARKGSRRGAWGNLSLLMSRRSAFVSAASLVVRQINYRHGGSLHRRHGINRAPPGEAINPRRHLGGLQHPSSGLHNDVSLFLKVLHLLDPRRDGIGVAVD